jgi:hypothetical protein
LSPLALPERTYPQELVVLRLVSVGQWEGRDRESHPVFLTCMQCAGWQVVGPDSRAALQLRHRRAACTTRLGEAFHHRRPSDWRVTCSDSPAAGKPSPPPLGPLPHRQISPGARHHGQRAGPSTHLEIGQDSGQARPGQGGRQRTAPPLPPTHALCSNDLLRGWPAGRGNRRVKTRNPHDGDGGLAGDGGCCQGAAYAIL